MPLVKWTGSKPTCQPGRLEIVSPEMLGGLPAPVQRYLTVSGVPGRPFQNNLRLRQEGTFRSAKDKPWMNVRAKQYFSAAPAGFVWDASFSMAGIPAARAYDSHLDTQERMFGRMLGLFTLMDSQGYTVSRAFTPQSHLQRA